MTCQWCQGDLSDPEIIFKDFPMYSSSVPKGALLDVDGYHYKYDFEITFCNKCGLIQQSVLPDMNIVYAFSKNEGVGGKWEEHYKKYANFILKNKNPNGKYLEIGGGNLKVADILYINKIQDISIVEVDKEVLTKKYMLFNGFFEDIEFNEQYDNIYSSHVFEHISDFDKHIKKVLSILKDDGCYYISLPNFQFWIENFYLNAFIQDHTVYPTENDIINYLSNNFELISKDTFKDHSLFFCFKKRSNNYSNVHIKRHADKSKNTLCDYQNKLNQLDVFINIKLNLDDKVYIFGSHIFAEILLSLPSVKSRNIIGILDNSKAKQDKYLYSYDIYVTSLEVLRNVDIDRVKVIVFAGAYEDEVRAQIKSINPNIKTITSDDFNYFQEGL
jgi:SAM-dependent methyltransferase